MGDYDKAEPLYRRSLAIWEKALGSVHPNIATSLNNIALLYYNMGAYDKAEQAQNEAKLAREAARSAPTPEAAAG